MTEILVDDMLCVLMDVGFTARSAGGWFGRGTGTLSVQQPPSQPTNVWASSSPWHSLEMKV